MLSIGEFSNICRVSAKTLRYYEEIGLLMPDKINPTNGYRYYSIEQLETMLFIERLKSYSFSLDEIKMILHSELRDEKLLMKLIIKKTEAEIQLRGLQRTLFQMEKDIAVLKEGKSIMSYLNGIDVQLAEVLEMHLAFVREMVREQEFEKAYGNCFGRLLGKMEKLTAAGPPMVLFHSDEFTPYGMDTEFAVPVKERAAGTRDFCPGLCLKTILHGSYSGLSSVYAKQREWAEKEGYGSAGPLYEVYITDPSQVHDESGLVTEIYYPVKKL